MFTITGLLKMISFSHVMHSVRENIAALNAPQKTMEMEEQISEIPEKASL